MEKIKIITDLIKMLNFSKEDIKQLVKYLLSAYKLNDDNKVCEARPAPAKSVLPLEVVYPFSRDEAQRYMNNLPAGYRWHLMTEKEAYVINGMLNAVNKTLREIGGDEIGRRNYMLADDGQSSGIVRYLARI